MRAGAKADPLNYGDTESTEKSLRQGEYVRRPVVINAWLSEEPRAEDTSQPIWFFSVLYVSPWLYGLGSVR